MIWVLGATDFELAGRRGRASGGVRYLRLGMGREAALAGMKRFGAGEDVRLLAVGFAGGLQEEARVGSAWLVREARGADVGAPCRLDPDALDFAQSRLEGRVGVCDLLTTSGLVRQPGEKRRLGRAGAALVDLEGYWIALTALRLGLPLVMLKVVSDAVDQTVPAALEGRLSSLLRPREAASLARLGWTAWNARRVLGTLTEELAGAWALEETLA